MTVLITILMILSYGLSAQADQRAEVHCLVSRLERSGHRHVRAVVSGDTLYIRSWPVRYGDPYRGMEDLMARAAGSGIAGVDVISAYYAPWGVPVLQYDALAEAPFPSGRWKGCGSSPFRGGTLSLRSIYLTVDVPFAASFGGLDDPFVFRTGLRPELYWNPYAGIIGFAGVDLYAHNEYGLSDWYRPANMGVLAARSFSERFSTATTWGVFGVDELWGGQAEAEYRIDDGRWRIGMRGGMFGDLWFKDDRLRYDDLEHVLGLVRVTCAEVRHDVEIHVQGGRYLFGDYGAEVGISRMFREAEIGFTGVVSEGDFNGYIHCAVPLFGGSGRRVSGDTVGMASHVRYRYRYNSKTVSHDPASRPRGMEPYYIPGWRTVSGNARLPHMQSRSW